MTEQHDHCWVKQYKPTFSYYVRATFRWLLAKVSSANQSPKTIEAYTHVCGSVVWSALIKANRAMWEPGTAEYRFGMVVFSPDAPPEIAYQQLPLVLAKIHALMDSDEAELDTELRNFVAHLNDDNVSLDARCVPSSVWPHLRCYVADCLIVRAGLPGGILKHRPLPVLHTLADNHEDGKFGFVVALHQRSWSPAFLTEWKQDVDQPNLSDLADQFAALQIDGLPPHLLDDLEHAVYAFCEQQGLTAAFLNVGYSGEGVDEEGHSLPASDHAGDLTFLGLATEALEVQRQMQLMMEQLLSPEQLSHISMEPMPMEEFEETHGWLLEELQARQN
jgi:hypothetical protein